MIYSARSCPLNGFVSHPVVPLVFSAHPRSTLCQCQMCHWIWTFRFKWLPRATLILVQWMISYLILRLHPNHQLFQPSAMYMSLALGLVCTNLVASIYVDLTKLLSFVRASSIQSVHCKFSLMPMISCVLMPVTWRFPQKNALPGVRTVGDATMDSRYDVPYLHR